MSPSDIPGRSCRVASDYLFMRDVFRKSKLFLRLVFFFSGGQKRYEERRVKKVENHMRACIECARFFEALASEARAQEYV